MIPVTVTFVSSVSGSRSVGRSVFSLSPDQVYSRQAGRQAGRQARSRRLAAAAAAAAIIKYSSKAERQYLIVALFAINIAHPFSFLPFYVYLQGESVKDNAVMSAKCVRKEPTYLTGRANYTHFRGGEETE